MPHVLMLGWEFPPLISGGLGTACEGLSRAVADAGLSVLFLLPGLHGEAAASATKSPGQGLMRVGFRAVPSAVRSPYPGSAADASDSAGAGVVGLSAAGLRVRGTGAGSGYQGDLGARIAAYAQRCAEAAAEERFDVIHAHDWMTFPAAQRIAGESGRPWIAHVHATEFDRSGEAIDPVVYATEREGVHAANAVFAVSERTRRVLIKHYGLPPAKARVVHNGIRPASRHETPPLPADGRPTVLFVGRLTSQKAPHVFVQAAAQVLERAPQTRFVLAGKGELAPRLIEMVAEHGLGQSVFFAGFLNKAQIARAYRCAALYAMPSISEPFGLTALEAMQAGVPTVISESAGVGEVLDGAALRVDWWDVDGWARAMLRVLSDPALAARLGDAGRAAARAVTWDRAAARCIETYEQITDAHNYEGM